jgi:AraC family transcriptional regulator
VTVAAGAREDAGGAPEVSGIAMQWLFEGPAVRVARWTCRVHEDGVTPERHQHWRVIGFTHAGAYALYGPRGRALVDGSRAAFFNPGEAYQTSHPCGGGDHGSSLILSGDLLDEVARATGAWRSLDPERGFRVATSCVPAPAYLLQRALVRVLDEREPQDALAIEEAGLAVAARVLRALADEGGAPAPPDGSARGLREVAEAARRLLAAEFRRPHRLDDIARALGYSAFHLCRTFRRHTGLTLHRYLNRLRLSASLEALAEGRRDLTELALDLGFSSHSHFSAHFRREFGLSPSAFRGATTAAAVRRLLGAARS